MTKLHYSKTISLIIFNVKKIFWLFENRFFFFLEIMSLNMYKRLSLKQRRRVIKRKILQAANLNYIENTLFRGGSSSAIKPAQVNTYCSLLQSKGTNNVPLHCSKEPTVSSIPLFRVELNDSTNIRDLDKDETTLDNLCTNISKISDSKDFLRSWGKRHNISHIAMTELLKFLKPTISDLPSDARTLYQTPRKIGIKYFENGGKFFYFGLKRGVVEAYSRYKKVTFDLTFNIDGIPLHKSTKQQFWPILCDISNIDESPFIVALYLGACKPPLNEYLEEFVSELSEYLENGLIINNQVVHVAVKSFCCDTPARCYIRNIRSFNSFYGCDKCLVRGDYINHRMTFCTLNTELRTDESFNLQENVNFHKGITPLVRLKIGLISQFPADYMHSVCLGVVRKMLFIWRDSGRRYGIKVMQINEKIKCLSIHWPMEFNRKPRSLSDLENWKAIEFRQFLLYVGPVVLKDTLPNKIFCNFMLLKYAISILLNEKLNKQYNDYANNLLHIFVKHSVSIYGREFCIYNTHSLIHIANDAKEFGSLNSINCFRFENFLGGLKRILRKPNLPLEQVVRRYLELGKMNEIKEPSSSPQLLHLVKSAELCNSNVPFSGDVYSQLKFKNLTLTNKTGNNCIFLQNGKMLIIKYFLSNPEIAIVGSQVEIIKPLIDYPSCSSIFSLYEVSINESILICGIEEILYKAVMLPFGKSFVCFPLLHVVPDYSK